MNFTNKHAQMNNISIQFHNCEVVIDDNIQLKTFHFTRNDSLSLCGTVFSLVTNSADIDSNGRLNLIQSYKHTKKLQMI